jgi:hypothetical protein
MWMNVVSRPEEEPTTNLEEAVFERVLLQLTSMIFSCPMMIAANERKSELSAPNVFRLVP